MTDEATPIEAGIVPERQAGQTLGQRISGLTLAKNPDPIFDRIRQAYQQVREAKSAGRAAVVAAIEVGQMLIRVKDALPHGDFMPWLRQTFGTELSQSTANQWMALARKFVCKYEFDDCHGVTKALISAGIIPEPPERQKRVNLAYIDWIKVVESKLDKPLAQIEEMLRDREKVSLSPEERKVIVDRAERWKAVLEGLL